jgi:hypothetical protein
MSFRFPTTQRELLTRVRGDRSQKEFAQLLEVDRTCLSRYETEKLGAPTSVINHCLRAIAAQAGEADADPVLRALMHTREAIRELEVAAGTPKI